MNISTPSHLYCLISDLTNGCSHEYSRSALAAFQGIDNVLETEYLLLNSVKLDSRPNYSCVCSIKRDLLLVAKGVLRSSLVFKVIPCRLENNNIIALVLVGPHWGVGFIL